MKAKTLKMGAFVALSALVVGGLVALQANKDAFVLTSSTLGKPESGSFTVTASDFSNGNHSINIGGITLEYTGATVSGGTVKIDGIMHTTKGSGSTKNDGRRGNGFTGLSFTDLDTEHIGTSNIQIMDKNFNWKKNFDVAATVDFSAEPAANRRNLYFAPAGGCFFQFSSLRFDYDCTDVIPSVSITGDTSVNVGSEITLTAHPDDVFEGDVITYNWSSESAAVEVTGNGATATVEGVSAADPVVVTCAMSIGGALAASANYSIKVVETPATIVPLTVLQSTRWDGAGLFLHFDPSSGGTTVSKINSIQAKVTVSGISMEYKNQNIQGSATDTDTERYITFESAPGASDDYSIQVDFKDNETNTIYRVDASFYGTKLYGLYLSEGASVEVGKTLNLTATLHNGNNAALTSATSSNNSILTVSYEGNVVTVTGVAAGTATITVSDGTYTRVREVTVTSGTAAMVWYLDGTGTSVNHLDGASVWLWLKYGEMGYADFASFNAIIGSVSVSYTGVTVTNKFFSDDNAGLKYCRLYVVFNMGASTTGTVELSLPGGNGKSYEGSLTFTGGVITKINGENV